MNVFRNTMVFCVLLVAWTPGAGTPGAWAEDEPEPTPEQAAPAAEEAATDAKELAKQLASKESPERLKAAETAKGLQDSRLIATSWTSQKSSTTCFLKARSSGAGSASKACRHSPTRLSG